MHSGAVFRFRLLYYFYTMAFGEAALFFFDHIHYLFTYEGLIGLIVLLQTGHTFHHELLDTLFGFLALIPAIFYGIIDLLWAGYLITVTFILRPRYSIIITYLALRHFSLALYMNLFLATHDASHQILIGAEKEQKQLDRQIEDSIKEGNAHLEGRELQPTVGCGKKPSQNNSSLGKANGGKRNNRKNKK